MTGEADGAGAPRQRRAGRAVLVALADRSSLTAVAVRADRRGRRRASGAHEAEAAAGTVASGVGVDLGPGPARRQPGRGRRARPLGLGAVAGAPSAIAPGADRRRVRARRPASCPPAAGRRRSPPRSGDDPELAAVLDRARDSGAPQLTAPGRAGRRHRTRSSSRRCTTAASAPGPPVTSTDRRARLAGWVVAVVDLDALVGRAHARRRAWSPCEDSSTADAAAARAGRAPSSRSCEVGDRRLVVEADDPDRRRGCRRRAIVLGVVGVVLAVVAAVAARRRLVAAQRAAERDGRGRAPPRSG